MTIEKVLTYIAVQKFPGIQRLMLVVVMAVMVV